MMSRNPRTPPQTPKQRRMRTRQNIGDLEPRNHTDVTAKNVFKTVNVGKEDKKDTSPSHWNSASASSMNEGCTNLPTPNSDKTTSRDISASAPTLSDL